ncbi:MAG: DUF1232 domain-containing protein [Candidatus Cloacimonadota bacterium]|nr:MAG: DUF1232 domain-containing protein [Candidatus Cloacimonadota bacterium]
MNDKEEKIEKPEVKEMPKEETEKLKEKIVFTDDAKKLKFYEELRRKLRSFIKNKTGTKGEKISEYLFALPDFFILLTRLALDKRITKNQKIFISGIIAYVIMPIDIIPDFIPVIGHIDDLVLVVFGLNMILNELDEQVLLDNWSGEEDVLELMKKITHSAEKFLNKGILKKINNWLHGMGK